MFDSLQVLTGNLVVPVVYRATLVLMEGYRARDPRGTWVGDLAASADETKTVRHEREPRRRDSQIDSEVANIFREIESKEQKPVRSLTAEEVSAYISILSDIATRSAAKTFVGANISRSEAKQILVRLREHYR